MTSSPDVPAGIEAARELRAFVADPKAAERREKAERRKSAAQVLDGRVRSTRRELDGTMGRVREEMRRRYSL